VSRSASSSGRYWWAKPILEALVAVQDDPDDDHPDVLARVKTDPGNVSLDSMLAEVAKLTASRAVGLPASLFADVAPRVVAGWRARAAGGDRSSAGRYRAATTP